ncbi:MAG: aminomethyl-transferring glycine dehydrogenase subunit GcvPA [Thermoplasmata archaeon]|nr:aminomethyl-transferring glycine dehydrogenase subunit GcvPA [Thermoplasmata archaeon]MBE3137595.1 aminomethyl-transferring glycine dehydrogenase subunit GcvPA [Thermoplasmata archaeon]
MQFIPNSALKNNMLKELGLHDIGDLFSDIPQKIRVKNLHLPQGHTQQEVEEHMRLLAQQNKSFYEMPSFLGGGMIPHYIPAVVKSVISRSEFYTAYTPYQPETSQGFLQAIFEYQSLIAELTGMDVSNASLYDGATAVGEAALMCTRINKRKTFVVPGNISWEKKSVLMNYTKGAGIRIKEVAYDKKTGMIDLESLKKTIDTETAGFYLENPNFFGVFEDRVDEIHSILQKNQSMFVVGIDPISLGICKSPGEYGADIVIGEGKSLGNPLDFGGSTLGIFACKNEFLRQIPGRIIGMTKDQQGKRAFCMTLQTREQHIRREKATSNICTNEGLCMLAAATYLSWLGSKGLHELSTINYERGQDLGKKIIAIPGFTKMFTGVHFNEFVIRCPDVKKVHKHLLRQGMQGGLLLEQWYPELTNCMLFGITELHSEESIERLVSLLKEAR